MLITCRKRISDSSAIRDVGQVNPLFKLMIVRSSSKSIWTSRQKNGSCAMSSGDLPATDWDAARTRSMLNPLVAEATDPATPAARRNDRRLHFAELIKNLLNF